MRRAAMNRARIGKMACRGGECLPLPAARQSEAKTAARCFLWFRSGRPGRHARAPRRLCLFGWTRPQGRNTPSRTDQLTLLLNLLWFLLFISYHRYGNTQIARQAFALFSISVFPVGVVCTALVTRWFC